MSNNYWAKRQAISNNKLTTKSINETNKQLRKYYRDAMKKSIEDFENTYAKILADCAKVGREATPADLYKLDKYWQLQNTLKQELKKLGDKTAARLSNDFTKQYQAIYNSYAIADNVKAFHQLDDKAAEKMINTIWCADGKTWSARVWSNTDKLYDTLNKELIHCVTAGRSPEQLKKKLIEDFNVSYHRANTLVRTEMAHIETQAAVDRYKDYGVTEYEVLVEDSACDECKELENKTFSINDISALPPIHCNCRCCVIPIVKEIGLNELL